MSRTGPQVVALLASACLAGCSSGGGDAPERSPDAEASAVVSSLGAVPIPSTGMGPRVATARPGRPAVLGAGAPVRARLASGERVLASMRGPEQAHSTPPSPGADSTTADVTLQVTSRQATVPVGAGELSSRDETGKVVPLHAVGARRAVARPGRPATLRVRGRFDSGAAQVTWRHAGRVVAIWTFTIELD